MSTPLKIITKDVCETCNNNWMSQIQNDAKPILLEMMMERRTSLVLPVDQQLKLARWVFMTSLTYSLTESPRFIPIQWYVDFQRDPQHRPSSECIIRTAARQQVIPKRGVIFDQRRIEALRAPSGKGPPTHLVSPIIDRGVKVSIFVGHAIFEMIGMFQIDSMPAGPPAATSRITQRLWSLARVPVSWPSGGLAISGTDASIEDFIDRSAPEGVKDPLPHHVSYLKS